jgi:hypothetical protein
MLANAFQIPLAKVPASVFVGETSARFPSRRHPRFVVGPRWEIIGTLDVTA